MYSELHAAFVFWLCTVCAPKITSVNKARCPTDYLCSWMITSLLHPVNLHLDFMCYSTVVRATSKVKYFT